jgi:hypothetical protein
MARAQAAVRAAGLQVTDVHERSFHVEGTAGQVSRLFSVPLKSIQRAEGPAHLVADAKLLMPTVFQEEGAKVFAFRNLPPHHVMSRKVASGVLAGVGPDNRTSAEGGYYFDDLKQAYDYPSLTTMVTSAKTGNVAEPLDGYGVNVAVVMYDSIYTQDVANLFAEEKWTSYTTVPVPTVSLVSVDGGSTTAHGGGTDEASLDVQMIAGGAPGAHVSLLSIPGLYDDEIMADYNYINTQNTYDIVNSSFGECELYYTAAYNYGTDYTDVLDTYHEIFTFVASSGDEAGLECANAASVPPKNGSLGVNGVYIPSISSPADDPNVTAVGGTNLVTSYTKGSLNSAYLGENGDADPEVAYVNYWGYSGCGSKGEPTCPSVSGGFWGATGGVGTIFAQPGYQSTAAGINTGSTMYRTNPDVGMQVGGCPGGESVTPCPQAAEELGTYGVDRSYVEVFINSKLKGTTYSGVDGLIGTSVSSPEFCSAVALFVEATGHRQGNLNPYLYHAAAYQTAMGGANAPAAQQFYHRSITGYDGVGGTAASPVLTPPYGVLVGTSPVTAENYTYFTGNGTPDVRNLFGFSADAAAGVPQTTTNP